MQMIMIIIMIIVINRNFKRSSTTLLVILFTQRRINCSEVARRHICIARDIHRAKILQVRSGDLVRCDADINSSSSIRGVPVPAAAAAAAAAAVPLSNHPLQCYIITSHSQMRRSA